MPDEVQEQIKENAKGPKRVAADGVETEEHSLADQIAADRYLAAREAAKRGHRGIRLTKLMPPGAA